MRCFLFLLYELVSCLFHLRQEPERFVQEKYFRGLQQQCSRESIYSVSTLMLTETIFTTIMDQRHFQASFERCSGPDLRNGTFTRHRELIKNVEGKSAWPAFAVPTRIRIKQWSMQRGRRDWIKNRRVLELTFQESNDSCIPWNAMRDDPEFKFSYRCSARGSLLRQRMSR